MGRGKPIDKRLNVLRYMPPLHHKLPGKDFDICTSQAIKWLIRNPEILGYLWSKVSMSRLIEYDPDTGTWKGIDYDGT